MNKKIQRNNPCYCGSGIKYKKCCYLKEYEDKRTKLEISRIVRKRLLELREIHFKKTNALKFLSRITQRNIGNTIIFTYCDFFDRTDLVHITETDGKITMETIIEPTERKQGENKK